MNNVHLLTRRGRRFAFPDRAAVLAAAVACVLGPVAALLAAGDAHAASGPQAVTITGGPTSAGDPTPVQLAAALWRPGATPAPAVVLAHGFGGSKDAVEGALDEVASPARCSIPSTGCCSAARSDGSAPTGR